MPNTEEEETMCTWEREIDLQLITSYGCRLAQLGSEVAFFKSWLKSRRWKA